MPLVHLWCSLDERVEGTWKAVGAEDGVKKEREEKMEEKNERREKEDAVSGEAQGFQSAADGRLTSLSTCVVNE